ncbi:MAG: sulfite exporter TauE/SafE family protein [Ilumatobacteraceae bacterium]
MGCLGAGLVDIGAGNTVWVLVVMLLAALVQALGGFGFALMAVPLAALVVDLELAVVAVSVGSLVNTALLCARTYRRVERKVAVRFNVPALIGMPIGLWVLRTAPQNPLKVMLGVIIVIATLALMRSAFRVPGDSMLKPAARAAVDVIAGWLSGILSTSTGTNGPPLVLALASRRLSPEVFRATLAFTFTVTGSLSLAMFAVSGMVSRDALTIAAVAVPLILLGQGVGIRLQPKLSNRRFDRLVYVLLILSGLSVGISGVTG